VNGFQFQGCTRFAVKLDFFVGLVAKALARHRRGRIPRQPGDARRDHRVAQSVLGDLDAMAMNPVPWSGGAVLPNAQSGSSYRVFAGDAYGA
jgi:4-hydroxyphenylacetate 3-monooxygenase